MKSHDLYSFLAAGKPFHRALEFESREEDRSFFYETGDIEKLLERFQKIKEEDHALRRKRLLGVYANIGDGKSTLLRFLSHLEKESAIPVLVNDLGSEEVDSWRTITDLVWHLLYQLRIRDLVKEKDYNEATVAFEEAHSEGHSARAVVTQQMRKVYHLLEGQYLIWLCDNVRYRSCLQAFQRLLNLRDTRPPTPSFFAKSAILITFSTSEKDLLDAWEEDPNRVAAGHTLRHLSVRAEDMLGIVQKILEGAFSGLPEELSDEVAKERKGNPVFPIEKKGLKIFLKNKARLTNIKDGRNEVDVEVAEIQLRNTLQLLQRVIDCRAQERSSELIHLDTLMEADFGG